MSRGVAYLGKTNQGILAGELDLSVWDEEELMRGQRKSHDGRFHGRKPKVVPKAVHDELVRRKMSAAHDLMRDNVVKATEVLIEIATDREVDPAVRLKAVGMIQDRVLGKAPEKVELSAMLERPPWFQAILAGVVTLKEANVIDDAEIVEGHEDLAYKLGELDQGESD